MTSVPIPQFRHALGDPGDEACEFPGAVPPLHPREHRVAAALEGDVEMPRELRGFGHQGDDLVAEGRGLDRAEPEALHALDVQDALDQIGQQAPPLGEVEPVVADMHPREDHLDVSGVDQPAHLIEHARQGTAPRGTARAGNDAERAGLVATLLHLDERPAVLGHLGDRHVQEALRGGDRRHCHDAGAVLDAVDELRDPGAVRRPHHQRDPRQRCQLPRRTLGVAAGDHDLRGRVLGVDPPDRLARGGVGPCGDAARIHHVDVGGLVRAGRLAATPFPDEGADRLGVILVQTAPEGAVRDASAHGPVREPLGLPQPDSNPHVSPGREAGLRPALTGWRAEGGSAKANAADAVQASPGREVHTTRHPGAPGAAASRGLSHSEPMAASVPSTYTRGMRPRSQGGIPSC